MTSAHQQNSSNHSLADNYARWDFYEASSSSEEEDVQDLAKTNAQFAAMEADLKQREEDRKRKHEAAMREKEKGNECYKKKQYLDAIECYTRAIALKKDDKSLYSNRSLMYLFIHNYQAALKDCNTAIDIYECFESEKRSVQVDYDTQRLLIKIYLRKVNALKALKQFSEAHDTLQRVDDILVKELGGDTKASEREADRKEMVKLKTSLQEEQTMEEKAAALRQSRQQQTDQTSTTATTSEEKNIEPTPQPSDIDSEVKHSQPIARASKQETLQTIEEILDTLVTFNTNYLMAINHTNAAASSIDSLNIPSLDRLKNIFLSSSSSSSSSEELESSIVWFHEKKGFSLTVRFALQLLQLLVKKRSSSSTTPDVHVHSACAPFYSSLSDLFSLWLHMVTQEKLVLFRDHYLQEKGSEFISLWLQEEIFYIVSLKAQTQKTQDDTLLLTDQQIKLFSQTFEFLGLLSERAQGRASLCTSIPFTFALTSPATTQHPYSAQSLQQPASYILDAALIILESYDHIKEKHQHSVASKKTTPSSSSFDKTQIQNQYLALLQASYHTLLVLSNLAFEPKFRTYFATLYHEQSNCIDTMQLILQAALPPTFDQQTASKSEESTVNTTSLAALYGTTFSSTFSLALFACSLTFFLNIFTHPALRQLFLQAETQSNKLQPHRLLLKSSTATPTKAASKSSSDSSQLFATLLSSYLNIMQVWRHLGYQLSIDVSKTTASTSNNNTSSSKKNLVKERQEVIEITERILALLMNLAVDDAINPHVYTSIESSMVDLVGILRVSLQSASHKSQLDDIKASTVSNYLTDSSSSSSSSSSTTGQPHAMSLIYERSLGLIGRGCKHSHIQTIVIEKEIIPLVLELLSLHDLTMEASSSSMKYTKTTMEHAIRVLANLLSGHPELATTVMNFQSSSLPKKSGLTIIKSLLAQQTNTFLCGNAALALGLCIKDKKEAIPLIMDAVDPLISLLRTEKMKVVHQNAAICLARMSAHPPVIAILREKRAMELMYGTLGNNMKK